MGRMTAAVACCLALLGAGSADAKSFEKGPYLQNVSPTSITVMWEASHRTPGKLTLHTTPPRIIESAGVEMHEVELSDLTPGTRYRYTVLSGDERRDGEFATAPETGAPFSFVVYGDSRSNAKAHARVIERVRQEVPDFLLGTGDMVNEGGSSSDWQDFFDIEGDLLREVTLFPSLGNHDRQGRGRTADNFRTLFAVPENSPDPERYYAFTFGNSRFLVLDSNTYSFALTDQTAWIEKELQAASLDDGVEHIFISMHHPPFSVSLHGGQVELREAWTPLFERYQVDAVFSGHDHVYSRAQKHGVNYFVSGGGGAPLYGRKSQSDPIDVDAVKFFERTNHHLRVNVIGGHVEVTAVRADGTIIETISWGELPTLSRPVAATETEKALAVGVKQPPNSQASSQPAMNGRPPVRPESRGVGTMGIVGLLLTFVAGAVGLWAWKNA